MIFEKEAVIKHIASVADITVLASDYVDAMEQIDELHATIREKDRELASLERENYTLINLVETLSRALCSIGGKE